MMKKILNKIISITLATTMLASSLPVSFVHAKVSDETTPVVEYSSTGETVEREPTGTDLDNFDISLRYGGVGENLGDKLDVKDAEPSISVTATITYKGNETYDAGEISFTMDNLLQLITRQRTDHTSSAGTIDIGAEYVDSEGNPEGTGRGDWYYTGSTDYSKKFTFTNKQPITTAFTSTVEIMYTPDDIRELVAGSDLDSVSTLKVGDIGSIDSNHLYLKFDSTHDDFSLTLKSSQVSYTGFNKDDATYYGYSVKDYWFANVSYSIKKTELNRGFNSTYDEKTYGKVSFTLPEGCFVASTGSNTYEQTFGESVSTPSNNFYVAFPKSLFNEGDVVDVTGKIEACFYDKYELLEKEVTTQVTVSDIKFNELKPSASFFKSAGIDSAAKAQIIDDEGLDLTFKIYRFEDNLSKYEDPNGYRVIEDYLLETPDGELTDGFYLKSITISSTYMNDPFDVFLYAKKDKDSEYELMATFSEAGASREYVFENNEYKYFKVVYYGTTQYVSEVSPVYNFKYDSAPESITNTASYSTYLSTGEQLIKKTASDSIDFYDLAKLITGDATAAKPTFSNNNIYWKINCFFGSNIGLNRNGSFTTNSNLDYSYLGDNQYNDVLKGEITFQDGIQFDINSIENNFDSRYIVIYNTETGEQTTDFSIVKTNITSEKVDEGTKYTLTYTLPDGYTFKYVGRGTTSISKTYLKVTGTVSMDADLYYYLKSVGKLSSEKIKFQNLTEAPTSEAVKVFEDRTGSTTLSMPTLAAATFEGVDKLVKSDNVSYTKETLLLTNEDNYTYKLRVSGGQSIAKNIIMYDNLEMAYGDNEYWQGVFDGIDTTFLDAAGITDYTIYYSSNPSQKFDLSASGWVKESDWNKTLSEVKSIAVDLGSTELPAGSLAYIEVKMLTGEIQKNGVAAYNSYAADYEAYDASTGEKTQDIKALESNITKVLLANNIDITIVKNWEGIDAGMAPDVEVHLYANGEQVKTAILSEQTGWKVVFPDMPSMDGETPITYTVEENDIKNVIKGETNVEYKGNNMVFTLNNIYHIPDKDITIKKVWNIKEDVLKFSIKDINGFNVQYDRVEIYDEDGNLLEALKKENDNGLLVTENKYPVDKKYTAIVYRNEYEAYEGEFVINDNPFEKKDIDIEVFADSQSVGKFNLNEENNYQVSITVPANANIEVKELTSGEWTCDISYESEKEIIINNNVNHKIGAVIIRIPTGEDIPSTGNPGLPAMAALIFVGASLFLGSYYVIRRKKK